MLKYQPVRPVANYLREVRSELTKITWPKRDEVIRLTLTVVFFSGIVGLYVGGLDFLFTKILESLLAQ